jgi:hypothetical protein
MIFIVQAQVPFVSLQMTHLESLSEIQKCRVECLLDQLSVESPIRGQCYKTFYG